MKRILIVLAFCSLSLGSTPANRRIVQNILTSDRFPAIQIRVSSEFLYIGSFPFTIQNIAAGERYVYAKINGKKVEKMFVTQFEGFLPESSEIYRYDFSNAMVIKGHRFKHNTFAFSLKQDRIENPNNEGALTQDFLQRKGFDVPDEWISSRFVTLGDEERKRELILFYLEPAASSGAHR